MEKGSKTGKNDVKTSKIKRKQYKTYERVTKRRLFNGKETDQKAKDAPRASRGD